jgi:hypothetical protein
VRVLEAVFARCDGLPAISWWLGHTGMLTGLFDDRFLPREVATLLEEWRSALGLGSVIKLPGGGRAPGGLVTRGQHGAVPVSIVASIPPGTKPPQGTDGVPRPLSGAQLWPVRVLADITGAHGDLDAASWTVNPDCSIEGFIDDRAMPSGGRALFASWQEALSLNAVPERRDPDGARVLSGSVTIQQARVSFEARIRPEPPAAAPPHGGSGSRLVPGGRIARRPLLPQPRPDSTRPGPAQRP